MRQDKLTTKLQEALSDASSLAVGNDNQYIEPLHLLVALLQQGDGGAQSLLQRAGRKCWWADGSAERGVRPFAEGDRYGRRDAGQS